MTRYCSRLVVYHVNALLNELRHPPGHDLHQRPQVFRVSHPFKPEPRPNLKFIPEEGESQIYEGCEYKDCEEVSPGQLAARQSIIDWYYYKNLREF